MCLADLTQAERFCDEGLQFAARQIPQDKFGCACECLLVARLAMPDSLFSPVIARCLDVQYCCADGASLFELLMCVDQLIKAIDVRWVDLEDSRLYGVEEIG